jgi:hypothetical protein
MRHVDTNRRVALHWVAEHGLITTAAKRRGVCGRSGEEYPEVEAIGVSR